MEPEFNDAPFSEELEAIIKEIQKETPELALDGLVPPSLSENASLSAPFANVKLVVCSAVEAMDFTSEEPWACISIYSHEGGWPELSEQNCIALLQLAFSDVECNIASQTGRCFSLSDARKVIDFVFENSPSISTLLIHCERGESRSVGIAAAIAPFFGKSEHDFESNELQPNYLVYSLIREILPLPERENDHEQLP